MNARLAQLLTINLDHLLKMDLSKWTLVPMLMIFFVVVNMCIDFTVLEIQMLSYMVLGLALLSFAAILVFYLKSGTISLYVAVIILFQLMMFTSTVINGTDIKECFYQGCTIIFIAIASDYYKERFHFLIYAFALSFSICTYLNFFYMMAHPDLWIVDDLKSTQGYILGGNYNQMGCRLLCAVATSMMCLRYSKWWIINVIPVTLISIVTLAIVQSMTSFMGILLFLLFCFIPSRKLLKTGIITLIATVIFFQVFVCFQGKGIENNSLAVWLIEDMLGKDITFTHRTHLWDAASRVFVDSPIYGYGLVNADWYYSHMSSFAKGPHNFIWGILIYGGIILLALFTYMCYMVFIKLPATNDRSILLIYAVAAVMFLMMLMEVYPPPFIITLLTLAFFAPRSQAVTKTITQDIE